MLGFNQQDSVSHKATGPCLLAIGSYCSDTKSTRKSVTLFIGGVVGAEHLFHSGVMSKYILPVSVFGTVFGCAVLLK